MIGIPIGTNCAPLLADLFLHIYEAEFIHGLRQNKDRALDQSFNSSFRYIDDILSLNNSRFSGELHLSYTNELEERNTIDANKLCPTLILTLKSKTGEY